MISPYRAMLGALPVLCALLLAACGSSTVVREGGYRPGQRVSTPKPGTSVVVRRGDTVYRLATRNGISPLDLAMWNGIAPPYTIYPGQRLRLYPPAGGARQPPRPVAAGGQPSRPPVRPTRTPPKPTPPPPVTSAIAWRWPADGQVVSRFVAGEPTRQGIDIAGNAGQPVRAAGAGVVVYSGSGLVGYGELIIVKHDEQWLSAYGHNRERLVREGQQVGAGQQIAVMGRSGAARDMLHFEIRYHGKPVDPLQYLPAR